MSLEIRAVASHREIREFIELPYRLHSTSPEWLPWLRIERRFSDAMNRGTEAMGGRIVKRDRMYERAL